MSTIETIHSERLGQDFEFHVGISPQHTAQLIQFTQDHADAGIQHSTSDWVKANGKPGRFSSQGEFDFWLGKGRSIYTLTNPENNALAGIVWFGEEKFPQEGNSFVPRFYPDNYGITYAIRTYGTTRGAGVAVAFTSHALNHFRMSNDYLNIPRKGIWLETNSDNLAAISVYRKLGCIQVSTHTSNGRILMVFP